MTRLVAARAFAIALGAGCGPTYKPPPPDPLQPLVPIVAPAEPIDAAVPVLEPDLASAPADEPAASTVDDDCARYVTTSREVLDTLLGRPLTDTDLAAMIDGCRVAPARVRAEEPVDCVLAASDADGVQRCFADRLAANADRARRTTQDSFPEAIRAKARIYYLRHGNYPTGRTPLTPSTPCCRQPSTWCEPADLAWTGPLRELAPGAVATRYQYRYRGTPSGNHFTVTAIGDPGCNGGRVTVTITGTVDDAGEPVIEIATDP
jgi:hypothetical protein